MQFDRPTWPAWSKAACCYSVVLHEMGHVLGIGTIWTNLGPADWRRHEQPDVHRRPSHGRLQPDLRSERDGRAGRKHRRLRHADAHWRDSRFGSELMTGYAGPGVNLPLSRITVGSLADIGYTVNNAAADAYTPSSSVTASLVGNGPIAASISARRPRREHRRRPAPQPPLVVTNSRRRQQPARRTLRRPPR